MFHKVRPIPFDNRKEVDRFVGMPEVLTDEGDQF